MAKMSKTHMPMPQGKMSGKQGVTTAGPTSGMMNAGTRIGVNRPNAGTFDSGKARMEMGKIGNGTKKG